MSTHSKLHCDLEAALERILEGALATGPVAGPARLEGAAVYPKREFCVWRGRGNGEFPGIVQHHHHLLEPFSRNGGNTPERLMQGFDVVDFEEQKDDARQGLTRPPGLATAEHTPEVRAEQRPQWAASGRALSLAQGQ